MWGCLGEGNNKLYLRVNVFLKTCLGWLLVLLSNVGAYKDFCVFLNHNRFKLSIDG